MQSNLQNKIKFFWEETSFYAIWSSIVLKISCNWEWWNIFDWRFYQTNKLVLKFLLPVWWDVQHSWISKKHASLTRWSLYLLYRWFHLCSWNLHKQQSLRLLRVVRYTKRSMEGYRSNESATNWG